MTFEAILFDLDNTLYSHETGLLQEVNRRIQVWVCENLRLPWEQAAAVRHDYYLRYGTTLNGLIAEHGVDAYGYLTFVHDIHVERYLSPDPALAAMLTGIPLRRVVYTNAPAAYSWRVLEALDIASLFERVVSIEDVGLCNKLYQEAYERALALIGVQGTACIMVEDSVRNLAPARALGLTTVLVGPGDGIGTPDGNVDIAVPTITDVGDAVSRLLDSQN